MEIRRLCFGRLHTKIQNVKTAYCTLFDSYYLSRGLLMLRSLIRFLNPADRVYVFCFDQTSFDVLKSSGLPGVVPVSLSEFETPSLIAVKSGRTKGEYCWTCTPHVLLHVLEKKDEFECTYLDADLYFYDSPSKALPQQGKGVLITEHRYTPRYDQTGTSGVFCVQFVTFRKTDEAMKLLHQWGAQCLEWCYNRVEEGRFGDQKYLDVWPSLGGFVEVSQNLSVGVAPWNIQQYDARNFDPVFYHFHGVHWYGAAGFFLGGYHIPGWALNRLYLPYLRELEKESRMLLENFGIPLPVVETPGPRWKHFLKKMIYPARYIRLDYDGRFRVRISVAIRSKLGL